MDAALYNTYNPLCTLNQCLQQVVGQIDHNPAEQFAACTDLFGAPVISTSTAPIDVVTATATTTVSYTDIIISPSTTYSTYESTLTSYANVLEVVTQYTTTLVQTITATNAVVSSAPARRRDAKRARRNKCHAPPGSSTAPVPTTSSVAPFPVASNCPSLEEYSSACACINAVSTTSIVTQPAVASTSTVYETVSTVIPSTVVSAVTIGVTTVVVQPATSIITSTLQTAAVSTTTVTAAAAAPTQTGKLLIQGGSHDGKYLQRADGNGYMRVTTSPSLAADIAFIVNGGNPYLALQPTVTLHLSPLAATYGVLALAAPPVPASYPTVTCSVSSSTGYLSCWSSNGYNTLYQCATYAYMSGPDWKFSGCTAVNFKLVY